MTMDNGILLGIDFGTGGCKVTAITTDGTLVADASVEYPTYFEHPGWSEQEPADWYRAMCQSLAALRAKGVDFSRIIAIAFDGSTHNAVLLDNDYHPIRRTIMWTDQRSTAECKELREKHGDMIFTTAYQQPAPTWTLPQMMWLKAHEPEVLKATRHVLFVKDYVRFLVTGTAQTDTIEAQGTLFFDMKQQRWSEELVALSGLDYSSLPTLVAPTDVTGHVTAQASADTGISAGTPVVCGTSDSAIEDYGAGAIEPGDCIIKLATAGNVNIMTEAPHPYKTTLTYSHVIPGMWYTVSATNAAALCQRWLRDLVCQDLNMQKAVASGTNVYELMDQEASQSPAGANGVFFHPYLQGERSPYWDPALRASFTGLSVASHRCDMMRALLEGVAFSLLDCHGTIREMGLEAKRLILIGGGARSNLWSSIVCDAFNLPLLVPHPGDASFGSALLAGVGAGVFANSREAVRKCLHIKQSLTPNPETAAIYAERFLLYRKIHDALAPVYAEIAKKPSTH